MTNCLMQYTVAPSSMHALDRQVSVGFAIIPPQGKPLSTIEGLTMEHR